MRAVIIFVWWFAAVSVSGEAAIMEFRYKASCEIVQRAYERAHVKTTICVEKG